MAKSRMQTSKVRIELKMVAEYELTGIKIKTAAAMQKTLSKCPQDWLELSTFADALSNVPDTENLEVISSNISIEKIS